MKKTDLYELAQTAGKNLVSEKTAIGLQSGILDAAKSGAVPDVDFGEFSQFVHAARHTYTVLGGQLTASELAEQNAARLAREKPAASAANQTT